MIVVMPTIQHTGTFFMLREIFQGFTKCSLRAEPKDPGVIFDHTWPGHTEYFHKWLSKYPSVTPLRSPERIVYSWERRERPLYKLVILINEWIALMERFDVFILPIDHPNRDKYLIRLNERLGTGLSTDWSVIPSAKDAKPFDGSWSNISKEGHEIALSLQSFYPPPGLIGRYVAA
ncbi:MAG: hypothetical protein GY774_32970 [Planctomycetes bacterium]|nr:hypothetical protein [Planctomycetota bacterium]